MVDKYKTIVYSDYHLTIHSDSILLIANRDDRLYDYKNANKSTIANNHSAENRKTELVCIGTRQR